MKDFRLKMVTACLVVVLGYVLLGVVGDWDYCEQVILNMSYEEYDSVKALLKERKNGHEPSDREIAHWWADHHAKTD